MAQGEAVVLKLKASLSSLAQLAQVAVSVSRQWGSFSLRLYRCHNSGEVFPGGCIAVTIIGGEGRGEFPGGCMAVTVLGRFFPEAVTVAGKFFSEALTVLGSFFP